MKTSIVEDVGDGTVTRWRLDKIKDRPPFDTDWEPTGIVIILRSYPHSGSHAMKVAWEKYSKKLYKLYKQGYVVAPEQIHKVKK